MAEEKKIADEILSDEELEHVAGGTFRENFDNVWFFKELYSDHPPYRVCARPMDMILPCPEGIAKCYKEFGIDAVIQDDPYPNKYVLDGKSISHKEAQAHVTKLACQIMEL
jgi:hypothetical protein